MEYTAIKELFKRFGHLLPDIENEFLLKEKEQMEKMYIQGREDSTKDKGLTVSSSPIDPDMICPTTN